MTPRQRYRLYEILPGLTIWTVFLAIFLVSLLKPLWAIYFIILFDLWWLIRACYKLIFLFYSWHRYRKDIKIDWLAKLKTEIPNWQNIYHLIILPTYKEPLDVIEVSFESLANSHYPKDKFIVVLAGEERDKENFLGIAEKIKEKYSSIFFKLLTTLHPKNLPNEIPGKGSNSHWAGQEAKKLVDQLGLSYENVIVSCFDVDTCAHREYFAYLTYKYLTIPDAVHSSFQPIAIFNNNIWQSPALTRVVARGTTFWLLMELARSHLFFTFSSHSMPFKALVEVGFWQKDVVSEDSRIFLQCFNYYNGNYKVVPLYISVSMDTVYAGSFWRTMVNQYKQMLRWGYGVENAPWMLYHFWRNKRIPFLKKWRVFWTQFEGSCSWATVPIIILVLGHLPIWVARQTGLQEAIVLNTPFILEILMNISLIGIFSAAILSTILLPPRPAKHPVYKYLFMILQWALFPITTIIFGSIPATEAITRLMLGKYLGFRVTEKRR
jgi:cellulose synthase/poly-beta-1,6-N-acetylglucosamine synthase-like glycosyltransferase